MYRMLWCCFGVVVFDLPKKWKDVFWVIATICLISMAFYAVNVLLGGLLNNYGLLPRHIGHLSNVIVYPFIHGSWSHLIFNLTSFFLLALGVGVNGVSRLINVILCCWLVGSISVWLFGRVSYHVGLSGIIYGLWGYLLIYGLVFKSVLSLSITFLVMIYFSSMLYGVLPVHGWISFESHLFGALSGAITGYWLAKRDRAKCRSQYDSEE